MTAFLVGLFLILLGYGIRYAVRRYVLRRGK